MKSGSFTKCKTPHGTVQFNLCLMLCRIAIFIFLIASLNSHLNDGIMTHNHPIAINEGKKGVKSCRIMPQSTKSGVSSSFLLNVLIYSLIHCQMYRKKAKQCLCFPSFVIHTLVATGSALFLGFLFVLTTRLWMADCDRGSNNHSA